MTGSEVTSIFRRLLKPGALTRTSRSVEIFGWIDLALGAVILAAPAFSVSVFRLPAASAMDLELLRVVGILVAMLGLLYIICGRFNSLGFSLASLLDRPLVPVIMAVLWSRNILPGSLAIAFSVADFGGFLWTAFAWRADLRSGVNVGGPEIASQARAVRATELFGWLLVAVGLVTLFFPSFAASLLNLPIAVQGPNYLQLIGLLVGGLGMLFVTGATVESPHFVFACVLLRVVAALLFGILVLVHGIPHRLAWVYIAVLSVGVLWTVLARRADSRLPVRRVPLVPQVVAAFFAFLSGVVRNARVFHPDGRVFLGIAQALPQSSSEDLRQLGERFAGPVLMRLGMGVLKRHMPAWLVKAVPDAPSIASRFFSSEEMSAGRPLKSSQVPLKARPPHDLDVLATAGGDRLYKLLWNLATGGKKDSLDRYDYLHNFYYADVPYRLEDSGLRIWIRIVPTVNPDTPAESQNHSADPLSREHALSNFCAHHGELRIEAQRVESPGSAFIPVAVIRFEEELTLDQESLHYDPFSGRALVPYGLFTSLRRIVYPASVQNRPHNIEQRQTRKHHLIHRFIRYWNEVPDGPFEGGTPPMLDTPDAYSRYRRTRRWMRVAALAALFIVVAGGLYLVERFTRDCPVNYTDDEAFFERGSTGGEKMNGVPYWIWVTLPEIFPEYLPDHKTGRGYASFGMVYEPKDENNPYALPLGMSRRNYRGIDVVYLNCGACHIGTVRDSPNAVPRAYAGMPAHQFDLGAWGRFLTSIPKDEKFTPQRILDEIDRMQGDPRRLIPKPDLIDRLIFRYYAVYLMREKLLVLGDRLKFIDNSTWGPGRVDTFNAPKALLNFPMAHADKSELIGNADFPSVWYQDARKGMHLHWDGNNVSVDERNLSAAFGTGAYPPILDTPAVQRMARYLATAEPPKYPYPIDAQLAAHGKPIYEQYCKSCHGNPEPPFRTSKVGDSEACNYHAPGAECVGTVVPLNEIGTDPWRFNSYTWLLAVNQNTLYAGYEKDWGFSQDYPQRFHNFRKTHGYAAMPLDGIWLRAPYLHNGSVPNLSELLKPPAERTKTFYRGDDVFDAVNVGFVSDVKSQNGRDFYPFDTAKDGNSNKGHEGQEYGTKLSADEKRALIEYLKTF
jgi:hypothetical protein